MGRVVRAVAGIALIAVGIATGNVSLIISGVTLTAGAILQPSLKRKRQASASDVQLGEVPREAIVGRAVTAGSLVDAFNYGGKYGTDWEVLVLALADHRCDSLEGFYVNDAYVAFAADGNVAGYNSQLQVFWRSGTEFQSVPSVLTSNGPGWTANDNGAGVAYVAVAYKADAADAKNPIWPGGRPRFRWVVRGLRAYDARLDTSVGGAGAQRWNNPATWVWSDNPIVQRYTWARGIYACDRVGDPAQLLIGRGLSDVEAPPANVFARANLCDELVGGAKRYRSGGIISAGESFLEVEEDFAAACAGIITQPQGSVEIDPGEARAVVATFTDDDLLVGSKVRWNKGMLSAASDEWVNTVVARYVEPTLGWAEHAAPVRRDGADIVADGAPREQAVSLGFVSHSAQAGRIAEIIRRLGRLWGRAEVTLGPRWSFVAEGDWVGWQSARHFGGATLTFRVDAWRSDRAWHHGLTLRQISASAYSDTAPLDDGSIAAPSPVPPEIGAPSGAAWALAAGYQAAGDLRTPVLVVTGLSDDPAARFIRVEYVAGTAPITGATVWSDAGVTGPDVQRREIPVAAGGTYRVGISYVVDGVPGDRLVLGPVVAGAVTYADGTPVGDLQPAQGGATRNNPRGNYSPPTVYLPGDTVVWRVEDGGDGRSYIRIGTGPSDFTPPSNGAFWAIYVDRGAPGASAFTLTSVANVEFPTPNSVRRNGGTNGAWDKKAATVQGGMAASITFTPGAAQSGGGLSTDPSANASFDSVDYWLHNSTGDGNLNVWRNGSFVATVGTAIIGAGTLTITSDGTTVRYFKNTTEVYSHAVNTPGEVVYGVLNLTGNTDQITNVAYSLDGTPGADGISPPLITLTRTHDLFRYDADDVPLTQTTTLKATRQNTAGVTEWRLLEADGTPLTGWDAAAAQVTAGAATSSPDNDTLVLNQTTFGGIIDSASTTGLIYEARISTATGVQDRVSIIKVRDGDNAITAFLTNESHTLAAAADGTVPSYVGANGVFKIEKNGVDISASFTLSEASDPQALTTVFTGMAYSVTAGFDPGEDNASVTIRATGSGAYTGTFIDKVFSLSKSKTGTDGAPGDDGAPGLTPITATASPPAITVPVTFNGAPKAAVPGFQITVVQGAIDRSAVATYGTISSSGISGATVDGDGTVTVTGMTADTGFVQVPISYGGSNTLVRVNYVKAPDGSPANVGETAITFLNDGVSYLMTGDFDLLVGAGQTVNASAFATYFAETLETYQPQGKLAYANITDGGPQIDMAGSESTGGEASDSFPDTLTLAGSFVNTTGAIKQFSIRLLTRKVGGTGNHFSVSGSLGAGSA